MFRNGQSLSWLHNKIAQHKPTLRLMAWCTLFCTASLIDCPSFPPTFTLVQTIDNCKWANSDNILIILSVSCWYRRQVIDWQHPSQQQQPLFSVAMLELLMSVQLMDRDQSREVEGGRDQLRWTENIAKQQHFYLHFQFYSFSNFSPPRVVSLWLLWKTYYKLQLIFIIHTALTFWRG